MNTKENYESWKQIFLRTYCPLTLYCMVVDFEYDVANKNFCFNLRVIIFRALYYGPKSWELKEKWRRFDHQCGRFCARVTSPSATWRENVSREHLCARGSISAKSTFAIDYFFKYIFLGYDAISNFLRSWTTVHFRPAFSYTSGPVLKC